MNPEELLELTTIISTKKFEGEVFAKSKIYFHDSIGKMYFRANTLLIVDKIDYEYVSYGEENETLIWKINCVLKIEKLARSFEKKHIPAEIRNHLSYDGVFIQIKSPELESGFQILSHYDYSKINIYNKIHREFILKQYIYFNRELYPLDEEFKKKIKDCYDYEYSLGLLNQGDFYILANELFEKYLRDLNNPHTVENISRLNQN